LLREGKVVPLTPKAYELLQMLVQNSGHLLPKEELLKMVWPDSFVEEGNLTRNISTLRAALGENSNGHHYIETVPKRGYRFIADVMNIQNGDAGPSVPSTRTHNVISETEENGHGFIDVVVPKEPDPPRRIDYIFKVVKKYKRSVLFVSATLLVAGAALFYWSYFMRRGETLDSIAVLPFITRPLIPKPSIFQMESLTASSRIFRI
jgi:DNA-binding winged helix-turn-helix (wHTH) protein